MPAITTDKSITKVDFSISIKPSSFNKTEKVAIQGKYIDKTTEATTNCLKDKPKGTSIPTAKSFLKNPMINAPAASPGNPNPKSMG